MADIVISIATKVAEYLVEPAIRQGQYLFCVNNFIRDLENEKEELALELDSLQERIEQARKRTEVIEKPVEKWLNDVKNLMEEVEDLEQKMKANNNCFQGWCPTWRRYRLSKQMVKKTKAMADFKGKSNSLPFSHPAPLPGIHYNSSRNFTYFESTKLAYDQLWEALGDDNIYMIGLYGMGGSGKTTLVTEVGKKANWFNRVILITVSQTPNIRNLQGKIADMLDLKLEEESEEGRAQRLWLRLKEEKRILIIADDLWGEFNLEHVGICLDNNNKGRWKVLLTTRRQEICNLMDCQRKIRLGLLSEDEAWALFQKHANIDDAFSSRSLNDVPRELCGECKGLPIAIVAVGSSLRGKSNIEWEVALNSLRHSETIDDHVEEGVRAALSCLKLSYDYLKNKEAELLFLMCSMFPEDYEIFMEDLIRYAVGLGIGRRLSFDSARSRIRAGVNKLVDSCLLMHSAQSKHHVKMHDMVRDVALWIAMKSEDHKILVSLDKPLSTLAEEDDIKDYFAVSLWHKQTDQISHQLDAPNLEILLLNIENWNSVEDLSHASFEGIEGLKFIAVMSKYYGDTSLSLPPSTQFLTNLQTLRLNGWNLGDMSFITSLTRLEILDLQGCSFNELPNGIEKLKRLKLLDLSGCRIRENYNYEAIGKCSQLEELYAFGYDNPDYHSQSLVDIVTLPNLKRFVIQIGWFKSYDYAGSMRVLDLREFNISLVASKRNLLLTAENVCLEVLHGGCKSIIPDMVGVVGSMNYLTKLGLRNCSEIECLIDTTSDDVGSLQVDSLIPRLVKLELSELKNLKEVCRGPPLQVLGFFEKLEELYIRKCKRLQSIFPGECNLQNLKILLIGNYGNVGHNWEFSNCTAAEALFSMSVAQSLQQLEELTIEGCKELKHVITIEGETGSNRSKEIVPAPRDTHFVMPNLKKLSIDFCNNLEFIFPIFCVEGLVQLQEIEISGSSKLKYVFGGHEGHSSLQNEIQIRLPLLKVFKLSDLNNIQGICPENYHLRYPSLTELMIRNCPKFTTSIIAEMDGLELGQQCSSRRVTVDEGQPKYLTSNLKQLNLNGFPELSFIWSSPTPSQKLNLQYLQHLELYNCEKLKSIFPMIIHKRLSELTSLKIYSCEELEEIIEETEEHENLSDAELYFPKLRTLKVKKCNKLKSLLSVSMVRMLPQLRVLHISKASQLEEVFRHGREDGYVNKMEIVLPNLTVVSLIKLPSFVDICRGLKLQAPKLRQLHIHECPKTSPNLRAIQVTPLSCQPEMTSEDDDEEKVAPYGGYGRYRKLYVDYLFDYDSEPHDEDDDVKEPDNINEDVRTAQ